MVWSQLEIEKLHVAYACVGIFSTIFSLISLFVKEKLYIGEATVATIAGLILGPHCLDWFNPISWGNSDHITLEISRIVLCIQIVAVAVELPRKYMKKHWLSVAIFLLPVMTVGWLVVGLFVWVLIPHFSFTDALLVSACVTATDPVLAAAVVGKGKFAERVPGHLRNLLSAESGCNDGMAFPFIFLSLNLIIHHGNAGEIVKDWILLTILWECFFGCILGAFIGWTLKRAVALAEKYELIDRESFLAIFVFIAFNLAGLGSILGVDDLLVSFAAGTAFGWNGAFAKKTEESHVSTVIDLLLNLAFFVYFGAIIPWPDFNNSELGLNAWRLIILAIVIIFLRRIPAVLALKPFTPDVKSWREALFCGHFGPIGVGAIFACILARKDLEGHYTDEETPLQSLPKDFPHYQLLAAIWPLVCFIILTSIIVHGSSVAVLTLGRHLNRMAITMSFTTTNTRDQGPNWMSRLLKLEKSSTLFSLLRVDTEMGNVPPSDKVGDESPLSKSQLTPPVQQTNTIETSGIKVRPAGGAKRRKGKKKRPGVKLAKTLSRTTEEEKRARPQTEFLQLGRTGSRAVPNDLSDHEEENEEAETTVGAGAVNSTKEFSSTEESSESTNKHELDNEQVEKLKEALPDIKISGDQIPTTIYQAGDKMVIEDQNGEIVDSFEGPKLNAQKKKEEDDLSIHSMESLRRRLTNYSVMSDDGGSLVHTTLSPTEMVNKIPGASTTADTAPSSAKKSKKAFYRKGGSHRKVYAHQVDNMILIENEDGDIIRRYRVNRHVKDTPQPRQRSGSIVGKALSFVGIKGSDSSSGTAAGAVSPNTVTPTTSGRPDKATLPPANVRKGSILDTHVANILARKLAIDEEEEDEDEDEDQDEDEEEGNDDDSFDSEGTDDTASDKETEIEKKRRLAALGLSSNRDEHDEED